MLAVKVFSATKAADRATLGEKLTEWLATNKVNPINMEVLQSSDATYHCLSIVVFYDQKG